MSLTNFARAEISRCPNTNVRRRVTSRSQHHDSDDRVFSVCYRVEYLTEEGDVMSTPPYTVYEKQFYLSDNHMVNEQGQVVESGGVMTEYDFYVAALHSGINFFDLQQQAIPELDLNGRFNQ